MIKVLFIGGSGRSGSTLLGNILGSLHSFIHVGELRYIWDRGVLENWDCGCGSPFSECPFWQEIVKEIGLSGSVAERQLFIREHGIHSRHLLYPEARRQVFIRQMIEYMDWLKKLYMTIAETSKCEWIVDSSKFPSDAYVVSKIRGIDLKILHLVRDPRSVAYSWWRRQHRLQRNSGARMPRFLPSTSAASWLLWNYVFLRLWGEKCPNYMLVRYEDLTNSPKDTLHIILKWLGIGSRILEDAFINEKTIKVLPQHSVSGNPIRFQSGTIKITGRTHENLGKVWKFVVSGVTFPLLRKFEYPLWK